MKLFGTSSITLMNKIITLFVTYMVVVIFLFSCLIYIVEVRGVNEINEKYAYDVAELESNMVADWLNDHVTYLTSLGSLVSVDGLNIEKDIVGLKDIQLLNTQNYRQFFLVTQQNKYLDTFGQSSNMTDPLLELLFSREKSFIITSPELHPVLSEALFNILVPVIKDNQVVGILGATLTMSDLSTRLAEYKVFGSGFGWLMNEDLTVIAHPINDLILKASLLSEESLIEAQKDSAKQLPSGIKSMNTIGYKGLEKIEKQVNKGLDELDSDANLDEVASFANNTTVAKANYTDPDGYKRKVTLVAVPTSENWYVAFTTYNDKLTTTTNTLLLYMAIGLLAVVIASVIASYLLANEITKPINQLVHTINLFIGGNRGVRASVKTNDEIGTLGKAFNGMADTIIQTTENVEELIQERTHMLADLNYQIVVRNKELDTMNKELETTNTKLHSLATTDMLTGLQNRHELVRAMQILLDEVLKGDVPGFSVLFVDLDNFKYYNDTYSHEIGDFLLVEISKILKTNVRDLDLVARYGGDEFVILLKHGDFEISKMLSERIHSKILERNGFKKEIERKIGAEIMLLGKNKLSCSIGIVNYNRNVDAKTVEDLLALADDTMYKAKKAGKSRIVVN